MNYYSPIAGIPGAADERALAGDERDDPGLVDGRRALALRRAKSDEQAVIAPDGRIETIAVHEKRGRWAHCSDSLTD